MDNTLSDIVIELDESFIPLGSHDIYASPKDSPLVVVPRMVEDLAVPLLDIPTEVYLGLWPIIRRVEIDENDLAVLPDKYLNEDEEPAVAEDETFPYMVLSNKRDWMDESDNLVDHYKSKEMKESENRTLNLGVDLVPDLSSQEPSASTVEKPHWLPVGETITYWVRPREWRDNQFMYMIRGRFGLPLYQLFDPSTDVDSLEITIPRATDSSTDDGISGMAVDGPDTADAPTEAETGGAIETDSESATDDDLRSDGGRGGPGTVLDLDEERPLVINDVLEQPLDEETRERWQRHGYLLDMKENRAVDVEVVRDLMGASVQVERVLSFLESDFSFLHDTSLNQESFLRTVLTILMTEETIFAEETEHMLESTYPALPEGVFSSLVVRKLGQYKLIDRQSSHQTIVDPTENFALELTVRPSAIYSALRLQGQPDY